MIRWQGDVFLGYTRCRNVSSHAGGLFSWVIHLPAIVFLGDTVARTCFLGLYEVPKCFVMCWWSVFLGDTLASNCFLG